MGYLLSVLLVVMLTLSACSTNVRYMQDPGKQYGVVAEACAKLPPVVDAVKGKEACAVGEASVEIR